jgi:two-component system chemotaxis response regulator CheY
MRQIPCYRFTPVIMLTTESSEEMQIKGKSIGVKAWLTKPFKPDQLKDAIAKLILP